MFGILRAARFLFLAPFILLMLFVLNCMTYHGHWWVQWAAFGMGIAWVVCLLRVLRAVILAGGVAALIALLAQRRGRIF
jgi:hypothetical protein